MWPRMASVAARPIWELFAQIVGKRGLNGPRCNRRHFLVPWSVGGDSGRYGHVRELNNTLKGLTACNHDLDSDPRSRSDLPVRSRWGDRCEIEGRSSGRDLARLGLRARSPACGHILTARVCPQPVMGPRMASVAAWPIWERFAQIGQKRPTWAALQPTPFLAP